ncbi:hypothetical protein tb265_28000 [Gemmatimonadetes bacterium T265]|nr:hypothetical protein tb265_28000 [Gemmatimonadetes bacterium T265]
MLDEVQDRGNEPRPRLPNAEPGGRRERDPVERDGDGQDVVHDRVHPPRDGAEVGVAEQDGGYDANDDHADRGGPAYDVVRRRRRAPGRRADTAGEEHEGAEGDPDRGHDSASVRREQLV